MGIWLVFAEHVIGQVNADCKRLAEVEAARQWGGAVSRVQSRCSYEIAVEEERVAREQRRPVIGSGAREGD